MIPEPGKPPLYDLIPLLILAILCALLITLAHKATRDRIAANRERAALALINEVMPLTHTNDLLKDRIEVTDPTFLGSAAPVSVFRARNQGTPAGVVFMPVIARGYNGLIELAVGIARNGELTGVRVHKHKETEGLGDRIDQHKSHWILGFTHHSLENTPDQAWAVVSDGGEFDQLSGATITPRGVINAVKKTLNYYAIHKKALYR
ncbi:MAG: RnfABCDGE type electron transport complex subunit G [Gammaproteobacteria bacterium]